MAARAPGLAELAYDVGISRLARRQFLDDTGIDRLADLAGAGAELRPRSSGTARS